MLLIYMASPHRIAAWAGGGSASQGEDSLQGSERQTIGGSINPLSPRPEKPAMPLGEFRIPIGRNWRIFEQKIIGSQDQDEEQAGFTVPGSGAVVERHS
jgi:hypothetical protein